MFIVSRFHFLSEDFVRLSLDSLELNLGGMLVINSLENLNVMNG